MSRYIPHDGATCFLALQFILVQEARAEFFRAIANRLRPGGVLASSDLAPDVGSNVYDALLRAWVTTGERNIKTCSIGHKHYKIDITTMKDVNAQIKFYKEQVNKGDIPKTYTALVKYVIRLRTVLSGNLSENYSFGSIFQGYMDYTYFYYSNDFLKNRKLKMGLVFNHSTTQFEVWMLGQTISIQRKYWEYFKTTKWNKNRTTKPQYAVLETVLFDNPDFNDVDKLSKQIEDKLVRVTEEIIHDIKTSKLD